MGATARVTVIGAGVIGLTCALRLREAGNEVTIVARDLPLDTTSAVAAALWYPYLALPQDRVTAWSATSYVEFARLAATAPDSAVRMLPGREVFLTLEPDPWWVAAAPALRRLGGDELPPGFVDGRTFVAPTIDMPRYLDWLFERVRSAGVDLEQRTVTDLEAETSGMDAVVVCAGLGSAALAGDSHMVAVRGQVAILSNPGIGEWLLVDTGTGPSTYVIPRRDTVICGGTADHGHSDLTPNVEVGEQIVARARDLVPMLNDAEVLGHRVGVRPTRSSVRVEIDDRARTPIAYCYGHGGAGVTLSWGCADEVMQLLENCLGRRGRS